MGSSTAFGIRLTQLEVCGFIDFSTPVMLSGSAAQAAVESKHPRSPCDAITVYTFSATVS